MWPLLIKRRFPDKLFNSFCDWRESTEFLSNHCENEWDNTWTTFVEMREDSWVLQVTNKSRNSLLTLILKLSCSTFYYFSKLLQLDSLKWRRDTDITISGLPVGAVIFRSSLESA